MIRRDSTFALVCRRLCFMGEDFESAEFLPESIHHELDNQSAFDAEQIGRRGLLLIDDSIRLTVDW